MKRVQLFVSAETVTNADKEELQVITTDLEKPLKYDYYTYLYLEGVLLHDEEK